MPEDGDLFFFQAEEGIRGIGVTGVQTCALPIYGRWRWRRRAWGGGGSHRRPPVGRAPPPWRLLLLVGFDCQGARNLGQHHRLHTLRSALCGRKIGRAACRERGEASGGPESCKKK